MSQISIYASVNRVLTSFVERLNAQADGDRAITKTDVELHRALLEVWPKISHDWYLRKFRQAVTLGKVKSMWYILWKGLHRNVQEQARQPSLQEATPAKSTATLGPTGRGLQEATPTNSTATLGPELRPLTINKIRETSQENPSTTTSKENDSNNNTTTTNNNNDDNDDDDSAEDRSYSEEDTDGGGDDLGLYRVVSKTPQKRRDTKPALGVKHPFDRGRNAGAVELHRREEIAVPDCGGRSGQRHVLIVQSTIAVMRLIQCVCF